MNIAKYYYDCLGSGRKSRTWKTHDENLMREQDLTPDVNKTYAKLHEQQNFAHLKKPKTVKAPTGSSAKKIPKPKPLKFKKIPLVITKK